MPNWLEKVLGFLPDLLGLGAGIFGGVNNAQLQRETNETNMAIAKMTNAAQAREHEKAYERSKATNQVNLLQQAGMSKAGALQTLNGGGSYQPAPMQSSQAQAPQLDLSAVTNGLLQIGENARQRKAADKLQEKQLKAAEQAQKAQFEENARQREHDLEMQAREHINTNRNADNRLEFDKQQFEFNKPKILAEIKQISANTKVLKEVAQGHNLDNIRKEFENMRLPTLAKLADISAWQNIEYVAMKLAHENAEHMNKQERDNLELEFLRATMDSGISLQNVQNELQTYLSASELNLYKSGHMGSFVGALTFAMEKLVPKLALFK